MTIMGVPTPEWSVVIPSYDVLKTNLLRIEVDEHPLKTLTVTERIPRRILYSQSSTGRTTPVSTPTTLMDISVALEGVDPLTKFAIEEMDPLTQAVAEQSTSMTNPSKKSVEHKKGDFEPWEIRKISILNQFTTSEKITIVTSFLNDEEHVIVKAQSNSIDKVQHKLEQLDYFEEGSQKKFDLSQVEYIKRIDQLNKELVSAWHSEQRVKALKIAIQCAKMLSDTDVMQFYPSKFVLITDILDVFGKLVYERLRTKADYVKPGCKNPTALPEDFTPNMVPESAKETCRNWFYKIASIRELVPRIYVEMAILKSYSFLTSSEYSAALMRLTHMIRGIGNPLVAIYARCYLCRVGITVFTKDSQYLSENFYDFLNLYNHLFSRSVKGELAKQKMEFAPYLTLYTPALEFILQAVVSENSDAILAQIIERCQQHGNSPLLLNTIMAVFTPSYVSTRCLQFLEMINQNSEEEFFPHYILLRTLGLCVSVSPPPGEQRRQILKTVWKRISKIENPEHYLNCAEPWVQYAVQHFINREGEINEIFGDIILHMSQDRAHEKFYTQLKTMMEKVILHTQDIEALVSMDNFLPLIDLFKHETTKVEVCKAVLTACNNEQPISDPVIINTMSFLCGVLHDSVNALTIEDESRQISDIICGIIRKIDYGRDFEQQLTFFVEARGKYSNLCSVLAQLVQSSNLLAVKTRSIVNGHHTRKTGAFVRACAAYCFITIPSITSIRTQLDLYLSSGQVALFNNCLGQADSFFKTAIRLIQQLPNMDEQNRSSDPFVGSYIRKFLSTLLVVPDSPDKGILILTRNLLNSIQIYKWTQFSQLAELYINVLNMLSAISQDKFPYYVDKVESNDDLYGSDPKFVEEVNSICSVVFTQMLCALKHVGAGHQQSTLALKMMVTILNRTETDATFITITYNLWQLALQNGLYDPKYAGRIKDCITKKNAVWQKGMVAQLLSKMILPTA